MRKSGKKIRRRKKEKKQKKRLHVKLKKYIKMSLKAPFPQKTQKVIDYIKLVTDSENYPEDFVKVCLAVTVVERRKTTRRKRKWEREERKLEAGRRQRNRKKDSM